MSFWCGVTFRIITSVCISCPIVFLILGFHQPWGALGNDINVEAEYELHGTNKDALFHDPRNQDIDNLLWDDPKSEEQINNESANVGQEDDYACVETLDDSENDDSYDDKETEFKELPHCKSSANNNNGNSVVVVSTLDGMVTGINLSSGHVVWSLKTGGKFSKMLSSTMSKLQVSSRGEWVRLIPSLDGGIYRFNGEDVEALPINADNLLHSSFNFNDDTTISGGKYTEVWGVYANTGKVAYICNDTGCCKQKPSSDINPSNDILVLKRISRTVRAIDPQTGNERWNFSVGYHELNIAREGCKTYADNYAQEIPLLHFVVPDGVVCGLDTESRYLLWKQKLPSPIVNAWRVIDGQLEKIDLFSTSNIPALSPDLDDNSSDKLTSRQPSLYVGMYRDQLYIQNNANVKSSINVLSELHSSPFNGIFPKVQWKPYLASAPSRTPVIHWNSALKKPLLEFQENGPAAQQLSISQDAEYPYDNGYYLYGNEEVLLNDSNSWDNFIEEPYEDDEESSIYNDVTDGIYQMCFIIGPESWWIIGGGIALLGTLYIAVYKYAMYRLQERISQQARVMVQMIVYGILRNNPNILAMIQRLGLQLVPIPAPAPHPPPEQPIKVQAALLQGDNPEVIDKGKVTEGNRSRQNSSTGTDRQDSTSSQFSSRYHSDFEPLSCLGRGGFGVVFHVRNKLDENEYAVKRILLPVKATSSERVKREVRALAKLNHTNIVRYYNSWLETPPPGWQDDVDSWWKNGFSFSQSIYSPEADETGDYTSRQKNINPIKDEKSLSDILNKEIPQLEAGGVEKTGSNSGYEEDSESGDESEVEDDDKHLKDSDSSSIVFQNSSSDDSTSRLSDKDSKSNDSFEIVFQDNCDNSNAIKESFIKKGDSTNKQSNSVSFEDSGVPNKVVRSTSYSSYASGIERSKKYTRRRAKSQGLLQNKSKDRPTSLSLAHSYSDPTTSLSHQQVNKSLGIENIPIPRTFLYIQMELCRKESLKDWLFNNKDRDPAIILSIFNDIVHAVEYVHDNQMMHRDLKPSNIFFSLNEEVKVGDFGLVTNIADEDKSALTPSTAPKNGIGSMTPFQRTHQAGTQLYMSPEQIQCKPYDYKVDIFSLGLIYFEMLVPFCTEMEKRMVMMQARDRIFPQGFREQFPQEYEVLNMMLCHNPSERPTTRGIRARDPMRALQGDAVKNIDPEDHFKLCKTKTHKRSHSGSFIFPTPAVA